MIYLDTSVALAHLLAEDRQPPDSLWRGTLVSSRLLEYEMWTPLHARGLAGTHGEAARALLGRVAMLELTPSVLARALDAFPGPGRVRTLDSLHLASCAYLLDRGQSVALASYDGRMTAVARAMEIPLFDLTRHGGDAMPGPEVTAVEMARGEGVDPKRFRRALRGENFPWHSPNARWTVGRDSPEHRDMLRVLARLLNST